MTKTRTKFQERDIAIRTQREWIKLCGGNEAGYIEKYGSAKDPENMSGAGGEVIFKADFDAVVSLLEAQWKGMKNQPEKRLALGPAYWSVGEYR